jgi:sodium transport system permease protein
MKNIINIFKKEFDKIIRFPRMIFSTLVLPGLLIFLIYAFMGQGLQAEMNRNAQHISTISVINIPEHFNNAVTAAEEYMKSQKESLNVSVTEASESELESLKTALDEGTIDLVIYFPSDFYQKVISRADPNIDIYASKANNSGTAFNRSLTVIGFMQQIYYDEMSIDPIIFNIPGEPQFVNKEDAGDFNVLAMLLPILVVSFIFGSALGIGSDAIAGEKERGTLATLLMSPISRNEIILGKIISTTTITVLAATSSFIGVAASLPFAKSMFVIEGTLNYQVWHFLGILGILILLSVIASTSLLVFSTIAKNVKEATAYAMPLYLIALIVPAISMFSTVISDNLGIYLIPIYNCVIGLRKILSLDITLYQYLLIAGSSVLYITLLTAFLIRLFKSEKVLFAK